MTGELHILAYRNTFLSNDEGRYVLGHLLTRLGYFDVCRTPEETAMRNAATELLEDCGIMFLAHATPENAEKSIGGFVRAISELNVMPLVAEQDARAKENQEDI